MAGWGQWAPVSTCVAPGDAVLGSGAFLGCVVGAEIPCRVHAGFRRRFARCQRAQPSGRAECRCLAALGWAIGLSSARLSGRSGGGQRARSRTVARRQSCSFVTGWTDRPALRAPQVTETLRPAVTANPEFLSPVLYSPNLLSACRSAPGDLLPLSAPHPTSVSTCACPAPPPGSALPPLTGLSAAGA